MEGIKINKVRAYREALGKTQKEISEVLNINKIVYGRKERGLAPFKDAEKVALLNFFKPYFPSTNIEELFF
ncbi:transcriptional regulator [Gemella cuniculi]|uniref:transcriptional regulator n=1 Tax=Gemella cuniculi TaxID=150240 RepID=UPI00042334B0|nr:transcriptional regulator [Gemella cuniculi]